MRSLSAAGVLAVLLAVPAVAAPIEESTNNVEMRRLVLPAPAVAQTASGDLVGTLAELEVVLRTGSGGVFVETQPLTQIDMQGAARLAVSLAGSLTGKDLSRWDFTFVMRAPSPVVGGPSAGALMTVAAVAVLERWEMRPDVIMTGMINPDGSVGPVGGIPQKAEAAANGGARLFLIPEGQNVAVTISREGNVLRRETVNVAQSAWERWRLEVREVADVNAALENFTGFRFEPRAAAGEIASQAYDALMGPAARSQIDEARPFLDEVAVALAAAGPPAALRQDLDADLARARERLDRAEEAYRRGSYYSASSLVFQARVDVRSVEQVLAFLEGGRAHFERGSGEVAAAVEEAARRASGFEPRTLSSLEALGASQVRVLEARALLAEAQEAWESGDAQAALDRLAFAEERLGSIAWWGSLARDFQDPGRGAPFDASDLDALAGEVLGSTLNTLTYAEVIVEEAAAAGTPSGSLVQQARDQYGQAAGARQEGLDAGALFRALEAQARVNVALNLVGREASGLAPQRLVERARDSAAQEIGVARGFGVEPVLAVSLHDFAGTVAGEGNTVEALVLYHTARMVAKSSEFALEPGQEARFVGFPATRRLDDRAVLVAVGFAAVVVGLGAGLAAGYSAWRRPGEALVPPEKAASLPVARRNPRASVAPMAMARGRRRPGRVVRRGLTP